MDLHTFIEKLKLVYTAGLANDWQTVIAIGFELIPIILQSWSGPKPMFAANEMKSVPELCDELKQCCSMTFAANERGIGPIAIIAWPILKALLIKILQGL